LANGLATAAYEKSRKNMVKTPFQVKFKKQQNASWLKGKEDDITVVIAFIKFE